MKSKEQIPKPEESLDDLEIDETSSVDDFIKELEAKEKDLHITSDLKIEIEESDFDPGNIPVLVQQELPAAQTAAVPAARAAPPAGMKTRVYELENEVVTSTPQADAVALATKLIEGTSGPFQPEKMPDEFGNAVLELVQAKVQQRPPEVAPAPDGKAPKVINIMAALKQSVEAKGRAKVREAVRTRSSKAPAPPSAPKRKPSRDHRRSVH